MSHLLFTFDRLALVMSALILYVALCIGRFSIFYFKGETFRRTFLVLFFALIGSLFVVASASHLALFFAAWIASNLLLVRLMIYDGKWRAARQSGFLAAKNFLIGGGAIGAAFLILSLSSGQTSISEVITHKYAPLPLYSALALLTVGALAQSAIWPFHRWLISSLNSATPVSALMHAGLINGGGFLIARFAPLYLSADSFMSFLFLIGMATAIVGTLWKLVQSDIKRMLACSTMAQMGFMIAQCGLGLFSAAIAHLIWHGLFKAYLFLTSPGAAQEPRLATRRPPSRGAFAVALASGALCSCAFGWASGKSWLAGDTTLFLLVVAGITGAQLALALLAERLGRNVLVALALSTVMGAAYGGSVALIAHLLKPLDLMQPQPLTLYHIIAGGVLIAAWLGMLFIKDVRAIPSLRKPLMRGYVQVLNASQPHPQTVTTHRNHYHHF